MVRGVSEDGMATKINLYPPGLGVIERWQIFWDFESYHRSQSCGIWIMQKGKHKIGSRARIEMKFG